jgi:hypothetical protein
MRLQTGSNVYINQHAHATNMALGTPRSTSTLSISHRNLRALSRPTKPPVRVKTASSLCSRNCALPSAPARPPNKTASLARHGRLLRYMASATQSAHDSDITPIAPIRNPVLLRITPRRCCRISSTRQRNNSNGLRGSGAKIRGVARLELIYRLLKSGTGSYTYGRGGRH